MSIEMNTSLELIQDIREGKMVVLVDDEKRENEGDLVMSAEHITPEAINFMAKEGRGLICLALTQEKIRRLGIPLMVDQKKNTSPNKTAFTVSIEASHGVSTGISAADRAHTIQVAVNSKSGPEDVIMPGHVFPIQAETGGVLKRAGHTEASIDLAALAGAQPAAVICEIMNLDGSMARVPDLKIFSKKHGIKMGSIEDLIRYRLEHESFVEEQERISFSSDFGGVFEAVTFKNTLDGQEHIAIIKGDISSGEPVMARMHRENIMGDVFHSLEHFSGESLRQSLKMINEKGCGVVVYLKQENKMKLTDSKRDYGIGAQILKALGVSKLRLLVNKKHLKQVGLSGYGIEIVEVLPLSSDAVSTEVHCP